MHYLGLALYAEGATDYRFLCPLLLRLCEDICAAATQSVDIGEVLALYDGAAMAGEARASRIAAAAMDAAPAWNILFVHADADGDAAAAVRERVQPGLARVSGAGLPRTVGVSVVPVRETEAWTLADAEALRTVFGTTLGDAQLGLTVRGRAIERLANPKEVLDSALDAANPRRRRNRQSADYMLNALGEQAALSSLRDLPSFAKLERDLRGALQLLGILG